MSAIGSHWIFLQLSKFHINFLLQFWTVTSKLIIPFTKIDPRTTGPRRQRARRKGIEYMVFCIQFHTMYFSYFLVLKAKDIFIDFCFVSWFLFPVFTSDFCSKFRFFPMSCCQFLSLFDTWVGKIVTWVGKTLSILLGKNRYLKNVVNTGKFQTANPACLYPIHGYKLWSILKIFLGESTRPARWK